MCDNIAPLVLKIKRNLVKKLLPKNCLFLREFAIKDFIFPEQE